MPTMNTSNWESPSRGTAILSYLQSHQKVPTDQKFRLQTPNEVFLFAVEYVRSRGEIASEELFNKHLIMQIRLDNNTFLVPRTSPGQSSPIDLFCNEEKSSKFELVPHSGTATSHRSMNQFTSKNRANNKASPDSNHQSMASLFSDSSDCSRSSRSLSVPSQTSKLSTSAVSRNRFNPQSRRHHHGMSRTTSSSSKMSASGTLERPFNDFLQSLLPLAPAPPKTAKKSNPSYRARIDTLLADRAEINRVMEDSILPVDLLGTMPVVVTAADLQLGSDVSSDASSDIKTAVDMSAFDDDNEESLTTKEGLINNIDNSVIISNITISKSCTMITTELFESCTVAQGDKNGWRGAESVDKRAHDMMLQAKPTLMPCDISHPAQPIVASPIDKKLSSSPCHKKTTLLSPFVCPFQLTERLFAGPQWLRLRQRLIDQFVRGNAAVRCTRVHESSFTDNQHDLNHECNLGGGGNTKSVTRTANFHFRFHKKVYNANRVDRDKQTRRIHCHELPVQADPRGPVIGRFLGPPTSYFWDRQLALMRLEDDVNILLKPENRWFIEMVIVLYQTIKMQKDHTTGKLRSFLTKEGSSSNICATKTISELSASSRKAVTSNTIKFALALQQYALLECPISPNALLELCEKLLQADDWKSDSCVNIVMSACTHANLQPSQLYETLKAKGIRVHSLKERQDMFAMLTALSEPAAIDSVDIHDACRDDTS